MENSKLWKQINLKFKGKKQYLGTKDKGDYNDDISGIFLLQIIIKIIIIHNINGIAKFLFSTKSPSLKNYLNSKSLL